MDIWKYIDLSTIEEDIPPFLRPTRPTYSMVRATATTYGDLDAAEREEWVWLNREYAEENDEFKRKKKSLTELVARIQDTVSQKALSHISSCDTAYEMLSKLKAKYCPTEDICKIELVAKFQN